MEVEKFHEVATVLPISMNHRFTNRLNLYSMHDNRYSLQNYGESLGTKGLGKKKLEQRSHPSNQHHSVDFISWKEQAGKPMSVSKPTSLSTYKPVTDSNILAATFSPPNGVLNKYHNFTKGHFHRFPHKHLLPPSSHAKPSTQTTDWKSDPIVTPLWVLTITQKPFASKNSWKYSYKFR